MIDPSPQPTDTLQSDRPWLTLGEHRFYSRLLVGIEQYDSPTTIREILEATKSQVFITTFDLENARSSILLSDLATELPLDNYIWIGTTSFAHSAKDAIVTARLLKQSLGTQIIKLDVRTVKNIPDNDQTKEVAKILLSEGFYVLPFIFPNQIDAKALEEMGCSALRLMASPVASGKGIVHREAIQSIIDRSNIPIIVEGGLASAADAALAMELGAEAVLVNTALVKARHPIMMATAIRDAVEAGRLSFLAGRMAKIP